MGSTNPSSVVYEGEVIIADFDTDDLEELEAELQDFVDLDPGEELFVSMPTAGQLEVRKLREKDP